MGITTAGYPVYNKIYPIILKNKPLLASVFDCFVQMPVIYFPMFSVIQEIVYDPGWWMHPKDVGAKGLCKWKKNLIEDTLLGASVWIPLHYINFKYIPLSFRIPFMA